MIKHNQIARNSAVDQYRALIIEFLQDIVVLCNLKFINPNVSGNCRSSEHSCNNGRCISDSLTCNGYDPCGDRSDCNNVIVIGAIVGAAAGSTFLVVCLIVLVICCRRRRLTGVSLFHI